jgi:outer membrane protein assembly factor BamA
MKQLLIILITLVPVALNAQQTTQALPGPGEFVYDNVGRPVFLRSDIDIQGSQYFEDKYCHATLKVRKGKTYHGLKVKIDLMSNSG